MSRRASRQLLANELLPGSAPYISSTSFGSFEMSINSGALDCMRYAISNELMRVAISGSPTLSRCCSLRSLDRKSTRLNSSHSQISYAVFCLKKKKKNHIHHKVHSGVRTQLSSCS